MAGGSELGGNSESEQTPTSATRASRVHDPGLPSTSATWLNIPGSKSNFRRSHSVPVDHVRQTFNWDCGLACVSMVLQTLGVAQCDLRTLRNMCTTTSIWTIDLAHLLKRFRADVQFCTITIGANPDFERETFYKENMEDDARRVDRLFKEAPLCGIIVQQRSLTLQEITNCVLSGKWIIIVLVDKRKLSTASRQVPPCGLGGRGAGAGGTTGHYVVLCGFDGQRQEFQFRDPASSSKHLAIHQNDLEAARRTFGTDEDLLLISSSIDTSPMG